MIAMNTTQGPKDDREPREGGQAGKRGAQQRRNNAWVVGLALVAVGLWALFRSAVRTPLLPFFFPLFAFSSHAWDLLFLPALGCVFLAWGVVVRKTGLLIPGGVLAGIGLGVMVNQGPLGLAGADVQGGVILASMGLGWAAVAVLALTFIDRRAWWPLIPAAVLGTMGMALMAAGSAGLAIISAVAVPAGLIAAGVIMVRRRRDGQRRR